MAYQEFTPEELASEEWRDVPGFRFEIGRKTVLYQVSSLGRARSFYTHMLKPTRRSEWSEYPTISLYNQIDKTFTRKGLHVAVAEAFHGPRPKGQLVNHKDGIKTNARAENLEYCTPRENSLHAIRMGLAPRGEQMGTAKLTDAQVTVIIQRLAAGELCKPLAREFGVSGVLIGKIRDGDIWAHIPRPPDLKRPTVSWTKTHPQYLARGDRNGSRARYDRIPKGSDSHNAKITENDVRTIRKIWATGRLRMRDIGNAFGLGASQIKRIIDKESWKHID